MDISIKDLEEFGCIDLSIAQYGDSCSIHIFTDKGKERHVYNALPLWISRLGSVHIGDRQVRVDIQFPKAS